MKKILLIGMLTAFTFATAGMAKDKDKDKDKNKEKEKERQSTVYVTKDGGKYTLDKDGKRHWIDQGDQRGEEERREYRGEYRGEREAPVDRRRNIYVIERDRPVSREVFVDPNGNYYRFVDGRRVYVREQYYETYPSKYYYPDGRRRISITLPF